MRKNGSGYGHGMDRTEYRASITDDAVPTSSTPGFEVPRDKDAARTNGVPVLIEILDQRGEVILGGTASLQLYLRDASDPGGWASASAVRSVSSRERAVLAFAPVTKNQRGFVRVTGVTGTGASAVRLTICPPVASDEADAQAKAEAAQATADAATETSANAIRMIAFALALANASSVKQLPAGARVVRAQVKIDTTYSVGATISVGISGTPPLFMATSDINPQAAAGTLANKEQYTAVGGAAVAVLATVGGAPAAGASTVIVYYTMPAA